MNTPKICIACGAAFKRSPADVTVRCPDCRAGRTADVRPCVVCNDEHVITEQRANGETRTTSCWRCSPEVVR
jgi:predicted  nucleic acid-binding Zn-ribbon protein